MGLTKGSDGVLCIQESQLASPVAKRKPSKRAAKTAIARIPQKHGGALLAGGVPGNKGGTGRPPNWLRDWCDELLANEKAKQQVEEILQDKDHQAYHQMWKAVSERAAGKPSMSLEVKGEVTHKHQIWKFGDNEVAF